ncbi:carboxylating nicotinate-nucleotide diphosphorylase [Pseudactinotalea sp.]|uniref:carboxylating nicotinate-nucleotide diphosphorylase n=1 Tax=Pseudactinotalea sp. TaxID=1926260 RepID=UPI003B3A10FF
MQASAVDEVVGRALAEDAPWGDLTCAALVPPSAISTAELTAREPGTFAGGAAVEAAFRLTDPAIAVELLVADGETFDAGAVLARVEGPAAGVLQAERIALNFAQRLSGIATATAAYVAAVAGTKVRVVDTRKTTPGLRALERHAVRAGGGRNHRFSLSDAVMVKDNHLAVLLAAGADLTEALRGIRDRIPHTTSVEVEVDGIDQIEPVLAAGVDVIMLDNFTLEQLREGVALVAGRAVVEASGNVRLETVRAIAETGVDVISVGALTHSVRSLDLGLDIHVR